MEIRAGTVSEVAECVIPTNVGDKGYVSTKWQVGFLIDGKPVSFCSSTRTHFSLGDTVVVAGYQMPEGFNATAFVNLTNETYGSDGSSSTKIYALPTIGAFLFMLYGFFLDKSMKGSVGWAAIFLSFTLFCGLVTLSSWENPSSKALRLCREKARELL